MRKLPLILLFVAGTLAAQTGTDTLDAVTSVQDLDLTEASIHQAGPGSFYVRSVGIGGELYSLTFAQDDSGIWTLTALNSESDNILPARTVLDFASLTATDEHTLKIDGVFVDGEVYAGTLTVGEDADLSLAGNVQSGNVAAVNEARTLALAEIAVAETAAAFQQELEEQRQELQAVIDSIKAERDALAETRDELVAERDSLAEELAAMTAAAEADGDAATPGSVTVTGDSPLTAEEVSALLHERDMLAGDMVGLALENNDLRDRNRTLAQQIADLQTENQRLTAELADMTEEVERLTELVEAYRSARADSVTTPATAAATPDAVVSPAAADETADASIERPESEDEMAAGPVVEDEPRVTEETADGTPSGGAGTAASAGAGEPAAVASATPSPAWTIPGDYLRRSDLETAAAEVTAELRLLQDRVAQLEEAAAGLADLEETIRTAQERVVAAVASAPPPATAVAPVATEPATTAPVDARTATAAPESPAAGPGDETPAASATAATAADAEAALASAESAAELASVRAQLAELVRLNEELRREKMELENRILNEILNNGLVAMMEGRLTETVRTGFADSQPDTGDWVMIGRRAIQTDSDAFFAKLALPVGQYDETVLYTFRVRSLDPTGWVGVGLHFFVDDVELRRGYGMGRSLLVWLTRDPDVYKTQLTYLQLYRSDDDINMGRVLDSVIEDPISEFVDVAVLYEPGTQYLTVAINGEDKIRYRTWFGFDRGVEVALRSLGAAEFSDFQVRTAPTESAWAPSGSYMW